MILLDYLKKCDYDARLERFFDQSSQIESYEVKDWIDDYYRNVGFNSDLSAIDCDESDADIELDEITTKAYNDAKAESGIVMPVDRMLRILYGFRMSINLQDDLTMLDRFEEDYFDALDNYHQKNYTPLCVDDWESADNLEDLNRILESRICNESAKRLYDSNPNIDLFDVLLICKRFIDDYEPDFELIDFVSRINSDDFQSLIDSLNGWMQTFIFCNEDAEPSTEDFRLQIITGVILND